MSSSMHLLVAHGLPRRQPSAVFQYERNTSRSTSDCSRKPSPCSDLCLRGVCGEGRCLLERTSDAFRIVREQVFARHPIIGKIGR
jgi:hypothetical protein